MGRSIKKMLKKGDVDGLLLETWRLTHRGPYATEAIERGADAEARRQLDEIRDAFAQTGAAAVPGLTRHLSDPKLAHSSRPGHGVRRP